MTLHRIVMTPEVDRHLAALTARDRASIFDGIMSQLLHQPEVETRRRKLMRPNTLARYRLKVGANLRVYYDLEGGPEPRVVIKPVGVKVRDRLHIGGEEVDL